jgi:hypothetical protein
LELDPFPPKGPIQLISILSDKCQSNAGERDTAINKNCKNNTNINNILDDKDKKLTTTTKVDLHTNIKMLMEIALQKNEKGYKVKYKSLFG